MTWNNRIIKVVDERGTFYGLHEVFYGEYGEQKIMWTEEPMFGYFDSVEELIENLELRLKDAKKCKDDVLDLAELEKKYG